MPLKREGLWRANFWVAHHLPYDWRAADIKLVEFAAERAWSFYELKRSEAAAQDAIDQLRRVTENAQIGLTRFDRSLRYLAANSAYARIVGLPLDQIIGRRVDEVLGEEAFKAIRPMSRWRWRANPAAMSSACPYLRLMLLTSMSPTRQMSN